MQGVSEWRSSTLPDLFIGKIELQANMEEGKS
jgi:hypothetical protein